MANNLESDVAGALATLRALERQLEDFNRRQQQERREILNSIEGLSRQFSAYHEQNSRRLQEIDKQSGHTLRLIDKISTLQNTQDLEHERVSKIVNDIANKMQQIYTPVMGHDDDPGFDTRLKRIEESEAVRKKLGGVIGIALMAVSSGIGAGIEHWMGGMWSGKP